MNRKLKNMLKNAYSAEPERKFSFIQQLKSNPTWCRLHPISTLSIISPSAIFILSTISVIAVGMGIIAHNFRNDTEDAPPVVPDIPPIVTQTTDLSPSETRTSPPTAVSTFTTVSILTEVRITEPATAPETAVITTESPISETTNVPHTEQSTVPETTSLTTTSVYYSHLFRHDYTVVDMLKDDADFNDSTLLYGYPDYNFFEDILTKSFEEQNSEWDEITANMTTADFAEAMMSINLWLDPPTIVEGETTDIEYIAYEGKPWTICEIIVSKVYNFKYLDKPINKGDKIKIAMPGGYMPVSQYIELNPDDTFFSNWTEEQINSTVIYEDGSNQNEVKIGDKYAYFLEKSELDIPADNLYLRQFVCDISQFTTDGERLVSCNSNYHDYAVDKDQIDRDNNYVYYHDPNSDRCIAFLDNSFLLDGEFYCYSVDSNGRITYLDNFFTDDGFFPFSDTETTTVTDEQGRTVIKAEHFNIIWTDTGVILKYHFDYLFEVEDKFTTVKFNIPIK